MKALFFRDQPRYLDRPKVWFAQPPVSEAVLYSLVLTLCIALLSDAPDLHHLCHVQDLLWVLPLHAKEEDI